MSSPSSTEPTATPTTERVEWTDALNYAATGNYLRLFGTIVFGWLVTQAGVAVLGIGLGSHNSGIGLLLIGAGTTVVGAGVVFVGVIATGYKLLAETRPNRGDQY